MTVVPARGTLSVQGLDELLWGFQRLDTGMSRTLSSGLKSIARGVAATAQQIAAALGLRQSGDLISQITTSVRGTTAFVLSPTKRVSKAYPEGFLYGAIYEYGGAETRMVRGSEYLIRNRSRHGVALIAAHGLGSGNTGPRAFLEPALEQDAAKVLVGVQELVERSLREAGF